MTASCEPYIAPHAVCQGAPLALFEAPVRQRPFVRCGDRPVRGPRGPATCGGGGRGGSSLVPPGGSSGNGQTGTSSVVISYVPPAVAPVITSAAAATFTVGALGTFTVTTTGVPSPSLTEAGALPGGVGFVDNGNGTATISGPPAAGSAGSYQLTITASNGGGSATQSFTLMVDPAQLSLRRPGCRTRQSAPILGHSGGRGRRDPVFVVVAVRRASIRSQPAAPGVISGTPLVPGISSFTVQVTDASNPAMSASASLSISVGGCTTTVTGSGSAPLQIGVGVTCVTGATVAGPAARRPARLSRVGRSVTFARTGSRRAHRLSGSGRQRPLWRRAVLSPWIAASEGEVSP